MTKVRRAHHCLHATPMQLFFFCNMVLVTLFNYKHMHIHFIEAMDVRIYTCVCVCFLR